MKKEALKDKLKIARDLYLTSHLTLDEVADQLNLSKSTVRKTAAKYSWRVLKDSGAAENNRSILKHIYDSIEFYTDMKETAKNAMAEHHDNPRQLEILQKTYQSAEKRIIELLGVQLEDED